MSAVTTLRNAAVQINDEFYTRYEDIGAELSMYKEQLKNKRVLMNFDNWHFSNFWKYLHKNFSTLGLKEIVARGLATEHIGEIARYSGGNDENINDCEVTYDLYDGDYKDELGVALIKECDIVITNPAFSCKLELLELLTKYNKDYLLVIPRASLNSGIIFNNIKDNKARIGYNGIVKFENRDKQVCCQWYTSLNVNKQLFISTAHYEDIEHNRDDNDGILIINKVADIPCDYFDKMYVPITYAIKHNKDIFNIIKNYGKCYLNGKKLFMRLLIQRCDNNI